MKKEIIILDPKKVNDSIDSTKKLKVAAYARVSTEKDEQANSLEVQRQYYESYIKMNPEWDFVDIYYDEGISGTGTKKRLGFNRMIRDALDGKIDIILVKSISRFARNVVDALVTIRQLKDKDVAVIFEKEHINTMDSRDEFVLTMFSTIAQEESKSISDNIKWSIRNGFQKGIYSFAYSHVLGFKQTGKHQYKVDKKGAKLVRRIYRLYLEGHSSHDIADILNREGLKTPLGNEWTKNGIVSILTNEKYKGDALLQKTFIKDFLSKKAEKNTGQLPQVYIKNDHEAIVSNLASDEVMYQLKTRKPNGSTKFPFSCKLVCEKCGASYSRHPHLYSNLGFCVQLWHCSNKYNNENKCYNITLYELELENAYVEMTNRMIFKYKSKGNLVSLIKTLPLNTELACKLEKEIYAFTTNAQTTYSGTLWRVIIEKVIIYETNILDFKFIDGYNIKYPLHSVTYYKIWKESNISHVKICEGENNEGKYNINPIVNSYAALWRELEEVQTSASACNIIQRILLYYFINLSGYTQDKLCNDLLETYKDNFISENPNGTKNYEKLHIVRSFLEYLGHPANEVGNETYIEDLNDVDLIKKTFELVFETMKQKDHYDLMTRKR